MSDYTTADQALTRELNRWASERRDIAKHGLPSERVTDRATSHPAMLTALEDVLAYTAERLHTGPGEAIDLGPLTGAMDTIAAEIRDIIAAALGIEANHG